MGGPEYIGKKMEVNCVAAVFDIHPAASMSWYGGVKGSASVSVEIPGPADKDLVLISLLPSVQHLTHIMLRYRHRIAKY